MNEQEKVIQAILVCYPDLQAIYLFGTYGTDDMQDKSDVDIALLLGHKKSKEAGTLIMSDLRLELETILKREVDLINLRAVSTVFQKEVVETGRRIYCADEYAADEFDMLTMSYYQKLNEERAGILQEVLSSRRFYNL
ncbi:MAG: nucleotidyltransferase domain-containing protein [Pseudomonadota bacterium]